MIEPSTFATRNVRCSAILKFISARYGDPDLDLERAAVAVRLSRYHLTRILKRETGFSFAHHIRVVRIAQAMELFRTTTLSVKEVAARVGYSNTNVLDRNFKRVHGVTPSAYRQNGTTSAPGQ